MTRLGLASSGAAQLAYGGITAWLSLNIILLGISTVRCAFMRRGP